MDFNQHRPRSRWTETHTPCPCGKSSDAYSESLTAGHCFSCNKHFPMKEDHQLKDDRNREIKEHSGPFTYQFMKWRGVEADTFRRYNCPFKINADGEPVAIAFPYGKNATKIRQFKDKQFHSTGDMANANLFGSDIFAAGSNACVVVTEGELDALSAFQMGGVPAVSVRSASSAFVDCSRSLDYLTSFNRVLLAFDNDTPGREATARVAALLGPKAYHVKFSGKDKDANDFLKRDAVEEFKNILFYARRFIPNEIISSYAEVDKVLHEAKSRPLITYPFPKLQEMTYGIGRGIILITAQEGQGKTEIVRAIEAHALRTTDYNLGVIHLEESRQRSIQGLAGYELEVPTHLPDFNGSIEDVLQGYKNLTKRDERVYIVNHFDSDDTNAALDLIRFLVVKCECRLIFLDHITQLVSALEGDDERKKLDFFSTKLEQMTQELDFSCILVSHVNDDGKTRGSRYISKVANVRIDLNRDHLNPNPIERNKTFTTVSKNRDGARTGPSSVLYFNPDTFVIKEFDEFLDPLTGS